VKVGTYKFFYSLEKLIQAGDKIAADCTAVSFDLFDTLFVRRVHDPDMLKLPVARFVAATARARGLNWSAAKVQKLRDQFEGEQRRETGRQFADHEACYPDYMGKMLAEIFGEAERDQLLAKVTEFELSVESSMLVPRQLLIDWLRNLHGQGKKILVASDIYLPAAHLEQLVERGGFADCVDGVVSSADTFLAKASGKGFSLLQERFALECRHWLHVGDNPISDGLRPAEFGLRALILRDGREKMRKSIVRRYWNYGRGRRFFRGRAVQQAMLPMEKENIPRPPLYVEGYNFFAPIIGAFLLHLAEQTSRLNIPHIYFLSREGWMFQKYWQAMRPHLPEADLLPSDSYLYVSRMALAGAACAYQGLTSDNATIAFLPPGNRDFRDICRIFKLDGQALLPHLDRHDLALDSSLSPHFPETTRQNQACFAELLEDETFQEEIRRQTRPYNDALIHYLEEEGFFRYPDVAIVDIGWLGTIQRFLFEAVAHRSDRPRLHGMLLAATRGIRYPESPANHIAGLVYDRNQFDLGGSAILYNRDLFEEVCRAPHPTLNGYTLTDDGCALEFRNTEDATARAEQNQDAFFAPLQQGILDAAPRFAAAVAVYGYTFQDIKPWINHLLTAKLAFPRSAEVELIRLQHHLDDFHGSRTAPKQDTTGPLWDRSMSGLKWNPLLRLKYYLSAIRERLRE
jgi:FMN phosphatase YigB (HAD superfamily)